MKKMTKKETRVYKTALLSIIADIMMDKAICKFNVDVNTEYTDNDDGLVYKETTRLDELDLTALLKIYETIED